MSSKYPFDHALMIINKVSDYPHQEYDPDYPVRHYNKHGRLTDKRLHFKCMRVRLVIAEIHNMGKKTGAQSWVHPDRWRDAIDNIMEVRFGFGRSEKHIYEEWQRYIKGFVGNRFEYQEAAVKFFDRFFIDPDWNSPE